MRMVLLLWCVVRVQNKKKDVADDYDNDDEDNDRSVIQSAYL